MADNGSQEEDNQSIDASVGDSDEEMSQQMDSHSEDSESDDNEIGGDGQSGLTFSFEDITRQTSFDLEDRYPELWYHLNESESDFSLIVNGQTLPANRRLLMERSVVFREMATTAPKMNGLNCHNVSVGAVETLLRFMLTEQLVFDDDSDLRVIADALCCARSFRVNRLVDAIGRHLVPMISADTIETIAEMAFKDRIPGLKDAIDNRLDELLTVDNVLSISRFSHECEPPSDRFVSTLRAFLMRNFDRMLAKDANDFKATNGATKQLWIDVLHERNKSGLPFTQDVHTLPNTLSSDEKQPILSDDHFTGGHESPPPVAKDSAANGSQVQLSQSQSAIDGNPQQSVTKKLRKNCKKTDESEPKAKRMATRSQNTN